MNIGKSVRVCLAQGDKNTAWLAEKLGVTSARVSAIVRADHHNTATIKTLADVFEMPVSEFVAIGEA